MRHASTTAAPGRDGARPTAMMRSFGGFAGSIFDAINDLLDSLSDTATSEIEALLESSPSVLA